MVRSPASASTTSTSTTSTAPTPTSRSRRPSERWPSWSRPARCATSACRRPRRTRSAGPPQSTRSPLLQSEWSLWSRDIEGEILDTCREHGIGVVAYSPLGRGFLTGTIASTADFGEVDFRRVLPRFGDEALAANRPLVDEVRRIAAAHAATPGQVALAWVLSRGDDVVPIPGTKRIAYLEENVGAAAVELTADDLAVLEGLSSPSGDRYEDMDWVNRSTPTA